MKAKRVLEKIIKRLEKEGINSYRFYDERGYYLAIGMSKNNGGKEIYNSNDGNQYISFAPTRVFQFSDRSLLRVTYSGCWVEKKEVSK